jgi:hypothetical protein
MPVSHLARVSKKRPARVHLEQAGSRDRSRIETASEANVESLAFLSFCRQSKRATASSLSQTDRFFP